MQWRRDIRSAVALGIALQRSLGNFLTMSAQKTFRDALSRSASLPVALTVDFDFNGAYFGEALREAADTSSFGGVTVYL